MEKNVTKNCVWCETLPPSFLLLGVEVKNDYRDCDGSRDHFDDDDNHGDNENNSDGDDNSSGGGTGNDIVMMEIAMMDDHGNNGDDDGGDKKGDGSDDGDGDVYDGDNVYVHNHSDSISMYCLLSLYSVAVLAICRIANLLLELTSLTEN